MGPGRTHNGRPQSGLTGMEYYHHPLSQGAMARENSWTTGNEDADRAPNDALSKAQPAYFDLSWTYVFIKIQAFVSSLWQAQWN